MTLSITEKQSKTSIDNQTHAGLQAVPSDKVPTSESVPPVDKLAPATQDFAAPDQDAKPSAQASVVPGSKAVEALSKTPRKAKNSSSKAIRSKSHIEVNVFDYIETQEDLEAFCKHALGCQVLAIDTEFLRLKTYRPQLCLIQMATPKRAVVVDPCKIKDLSAIAPLLEAKHLTKLFHAGAQDIEILWDRLKVMPSPIFDTQIAATQLGYSQQVGYGMLVQSECGVTLSKADSFTDWSRRPLTKSQLLYAAHDVIYLVRIYSSMKAQLEELGRLSWLDDDFAAMSDPKRYQKDPSTCYLHVKKVNQLKGAQLACAREVAAWREREAQRKNLIRKYILTDEELVEACRRKCTRIDELFLIQGLKNHVNIQAAREICSCIERGLNCPSADWPKIKGKSSGEVNVDVEVDLLSALLRLRARENKVAFQTLCSKDDLVNLARGHLDDVELLRGWRAKLVGDEVLDLLHGKICLSLEQGKLQVIRKES